MSTQTFWIGRRVPQQLGVSAVSCEPHSSLRPLTSRTLALLCAHMCSDLVMGSLIKNAGGTLAPGGGYVAGRADLVSAVGARLAAPGIGTDAGGVPGTTLRLLFQGAPSYDDYTSSLVHFLYVGYMLRTWHWQLARVCLVVPCIQGCWFPAPCAQSLL